MRELKINRTQEKNVISRGYSIAKTENELLKEINKALATQESGAVFIGALQSNVLSNLMQETGDSTLFKEGDYAFGIRYDDIRHLRKHFDNAQDMSDAVKDMYAMFADHDVAIVHREGTGPVQLELRKGKQSIEITGFTILSRRARQATMRTLFLSKGTIENWRGLNHATALRSNAAPRGVTSNNRDLSQNDQDVKDAFLNDLRSTDGAETHYGDEQNFPYG